MTRLLPSIQNCPSFQYGIAAEDLDRLRCLGFRSPEGSLNLAYVMIRNPRVDQIVLRIGATARGR